MSSTGVQDRGPRDDKLASMKPRDEIARRLDAMEADREGTADKTFIGGYELRGLDPDFVYLDHDTFEHPRTFPRRKKVIATALTIALVFMAPFCSTIIAPAVQLVMADLAITDTTVGALMVSIFMFAYGLGPIFLAPVSELYGRVPVAMVGNVIFGVFCIGGGFSQTPAQLALCRFLAGLAGSSVLAVIGGTVADMWELEARPAVQGFIMIGVIFGPILGPVCGGWMAERASWRWTMWVPGIAALVVGILGLFFLYESYAPTLLREKVAREKKEKPGRQLYSVLDLQEQPGTFAFLFSQFARPIVYLFVDPALFFSSVYYSIVFGIFYLVIVTYSDVFGLLYGHSVGIVGTEFLAIGVGMLIGTIATVKAQEWLFPKDGKQNAKSAESRLLSGALGPLLIAAGLFIYGFTAVEEHFMVPLVGIMIFSIGHVNVMMAIQLYSVDGFSYPASAFATISFLRSEFGGAFPLFGAKLFDALGLDWGAGLLAFLALGIGLPYIPGLYMFGVKLRRVGVRNMDWFVGKTPAPA